MYSPEDNSMQKTAPISGKFVEIFTAKTPVLPKAPNLTILFVAMVLVLSKDNLNEIEDFHQEKHNTVFVLFL